MDDPSRSETLPPDEPLFVLKYSKGRVFWRELCLTFLTFPFLILAYFLAHPFTTAAGFADLLFEEAFCGLIIAILVSGIVVPLCFKEIRIYGDRIVKVSNRMRMKEIMLEKATLHTPNDYFRIKVISDDNWSCLWPSRNAITYDERLADPEDVKKFNCLLAVLSGRTVEEFEKETIMDPLIRTRRVPRVIDEHLFHDQDSGAGRGGREFGNSPNKENGTRQFSAKTDTGRLMEAGLSPQTIYEHTLDEQTLRAVADEKDFERTSNRALLVVGLFALMVPCGLMCGMVWQSAGPVALMFMILPVAVFGYMIWSAR